MIIQMAESNIGDLAKTYEGFIVSGRIVPKYENGNWTYTEEIFTEPYYKEYELEDIDPSYIDSPSKAIFLYYDDMVCVGQIRLCSNWNGLALIEDIAIAKDWRNKGIGTALRRRYDAVRQTPDSRREGDFLVPLNNEA